MTFPSFHQDDDLYFITATIIGWKNLFMNDEYAKIVMESLAWLRVNKRMHLFAYMLMPNHLHAVIKPINLNIGKLLQSFGSFSSHRIVKALISNHADELLKFFHGERTDKRSNYAIWQDIQAKNIFSVKFLDQKLEYIHQNPIKSIFNGYTYSKHFLYSSSNFYETGKPGLIEIDDIRVYLEDPDKFNDSGRRGRRPEPP